MDSFSYYQKLKRDYWRVGIILLLCLFGLSLLTLLVGPGMIITPWGGQVESLGHIFIWQLRGPRLLSAFFAGGSLGLVALLLQSYFKNPLAGPFVLGIHSGAALGVALWIFYFEKLLVNHQWILSLGQIPFAFLGSLLVMLLLLLIMRYSFSKVLLLVVGLIFSYFVSGVINILVNISDSVKIKTFVLWNLGSFDRLSSEELFIFIGGVILLTTLVLPLGKSLNLLALGEGHARSLGLNLVRVKRHLLFVSAILTALVVSFCGPIAFIGIISPHLLRLFVRGSDNRYLIPLVFLLGGVLAIGAAFLSSSLPWFQLPLNAILGLFGAPVLFFILTSKRLRGVE